MFDIFLKNLCNSLKFGEKAFENVACAQILIVYAQKLITPIPLFGVDLHHKNFQNVFSYKIGLVF